MGAGQSVIDLDHTKKFVDHTADLSKTFDRLQGRLVAAEKEQDDIRRKKAALEAKLSAQANDLIVKKQKLEDQLSRLDKNSVTSRQPLEAQLNDITKKLQVAITSTNSMKTNVNKFRTQFFTPKNNSVTPVAAVTPAPTALLSAGKNGVAIKA